jgi:peroxiredoxin family protein
MTTQHPLSVLLYTGSFDKIHYALALASAGAAIGRKTEVFVTMGACKAFAYRHDKTKRWDTLPLSNSMDSIAVTSPKELNSYYRSQDIATFDELLQACIDLGVRFAICEMGLRAMGITEEFLLPECQFTISGLATFLRESQGADIISI